MRQRTSIQPDLVSTIEACYRVEQTSEQWLREVIETLSWLDQGLGIFGFTYTLTRSFELEPGPLVARDCPAEVQDALHVAFENPPDFNRAYLSVDFGAASGLTGFEGSKIDVTARTLGVVDSWAINGRDWDGRNVAVIVNRNEATVPPPRISSALKRIAVHLAAGARLQRRLQAGVPAAHVEAILTPSGRVEHAEARAIPALHALSNATRAIETARADLRDSNPEQALRTWKGRAAARWTLVEHFESDGRRYVLARENEPEIGDLMALSSRERQVLASAALGRSNKEIAYELGLADTTVRVLLARAASKLRTRGRQATITRFLEGGPQER